jgi:hypothetical protein
MPTGQPAGGWRYDFSSFQTASYEKSEFCNSTSYILLLASIKIKK